MFLISISIQKTKLSGELSWSFPPPPPPRVCLVGFVCLFVFLVCRSQNQCLVFSGGLQRSKRLKAPLSACCGLLCREMLMNALQRCLFWLRTVSPFLEFRLELGLVLLMCFPVLLEAALAQIFYWCLLHCEAIMNTALLQIKSNSTSLPYLAREQHTNSSILTYSTYMTQHTN